MVSILISDLGNVLLPFQLEPAFAALAAAGEPRSDLQEVVRRVYLESGISLGACSAQDFFDKMRSALGLQLSYQQFHRAWSNIFSEDTAVTALIAEANVRHRYLLSNTDPLHWEWIQTHFPQVLADFDRLFASHECRMLKPDPAFYQLVMRESGAPAPAHLFIDDLPENVAAADALGMDTILFRDADSLRAALQERALITA
ncbi:MAG TPA: HAD-IA family hydrolase [Armatimonadota bacterium]|nr:HAD-IA family hydrolase [Armatimonadota bacterium]